MSSATYDVVICGGGNKALMLAMYLTKFAGLKCGIFERRHELGGGLATEEIAAPGFRGNTHANLMLPWYWTPLYRDFPEFWDYGAMVDQYKCSDGAIFLDSGKCLGIYSNKIDHTQERTATQIARFSQKDADTWLKLWTVTNSDEFQRVLYDSLLNPHEWQARPEFFDRQMAVFAVLQEAGIDPMPYMTASPLEAVQMMFESPELRYTVLRFYPSSVMNVRDSSKGVTLPGMVNMMPMMSFVRGGTHMIAHACHQWLVQHGCEFHINKTVVKVIHDGKRASGIELHDGSVVDARKMVVTAGLSVMQLLDVVGRDVFGPEICEKVDNLSFNNIGNIMWYSYALHEAPSYSAEAFNPDIHETFWLGLTTSADLEHLGRECDEATQGKMPALDDFNPVVWCHSLVDPSYAPAGKHVAQHEMQGPRATDLSQDDYLRLKDKHAEDMIEFWGKFAPNMTWNNVIGIDTNSPFDVRRMANLAPHGNFAGIDKSASQDGPNRPTPELANHRTPIHNLYCTGGYWHVGGEASSAQAYNCYKIIASDLKLDGQPWQQPGNEEPDSLRAQQGLLFERMRNAFPAGSRES
jgi:beta-carotene ketolase (CrtO type)